MSESIKKINLRDFVYLDVDRVKSLLAQLEEGLLLDRSDTVSTSGSIEAGAKINIPLLAHFGGTGQYVTTNQSIETRTLHDHVYNYMEKMLINNNRITVLPDDFSAQDIRENDIRQQLSPVGYLLSRGKIQIRDMRVITDLVSDINEMQLALARIAASASFANLDKNERQKRIHAIEKQNRSQHLDTQLHKDIMKLLDKFYRDRLIIRLMPFDDGDIRIVGPLRESYLRDSISDIRFKYGFSPRDDWTVFAQVAAIPEAGSATANFAQNFTVDLEAAIEQLFGAATDIEAMQRIAYPEIAVTPIAIYRE